MKRRTLYIVNTVIVLLAAALWFVPYTERVSDTRTAVAFIDGEAVGTTSIAVDITINHYMFRPSEAYGAITVDADSAEPLVYEVTYYDRSFAEFKTGSMGRWNDDFKTFDFKRIYATPDDRLMILSASGESDRYSYIAFNGTYEDAADAFTELTAVLDLESLGFTENPFE